MAEEVRVDITGTSSSVEQAVDKTIEKLDTLFNFVSRNMPKMAQDIAAPFSNQLNNSPFVKALLEIENNSNITFNKLKTHFTDYAKAVGLTTAQSNAIFTRHFGDIERKSVQSFTSVGKIIEDRIKQGSTNSINASNSAFNSYFAGIEAKTKITFTNVKSYIDNAFNTGKSRSAKDSFDFFSQMGMTTPASTATPAAAFSGVALAIAAINQGLEVARKIWQSIETSVRFVTGLLIEGLKYVDLYKETEFGFAGLIFQLTDIYEGQRKVTEATERWTGSLEIGKEITSQLQDAALKTKVTFSELAVGMQQGLGPLLQGGVGQAEITPFVTRFIQTMTALRVPMREIGQEIRGFFNLETNPRVSRVSFAMISQMAKQMGVDIGEAKKQLQDLKQTGTLDDWFMGNTQGMERAADLVMKGTMGGMISNLKELKERILGLGTEELYTTIVHGIEKATDALVTFDEKGKAVFNQDFVDMIKAVAGAFGEVVNQLAGIVAKMPEVINSARTFWTLMQDSVPVGSKETVSMGQKLIEGALNLGPMGYNKAVIKGAMSLEEYLSQTYNSGLLKPKPGELGTYSRLETVTSKEGISAYSPSFLEYQRKQKELERQAILNAGYDNESDFIGPKQPFGPYLPADKTKYHFDPANLNPPETEESKKEREKAIDKLIKDNLAFNEKAAKDRDKLDEAWISGINKMGSRITTEYNKNARRIVPEGLEAWIDNPKNPVQQPIPYILKNGQMGDKKEYEADLVDTKRQVDAMKAAADAFNRRVDIYFRGPLANAFEGLARGGARGFMESMQQGFSQLVSLGAGNLANLLSGGDVRVDEEGNRFLGGSETPMSPKEWENYQAKQKKIQTGIMFAQVGLGSYQNAKQNYEGSITSGMIGGAMAGAATGQLGLAIAAAIVGGISAALAKEDTRDKYKFATGAINIRGEGVLYPNKNINKQEQDEMIAKMTDVFNTFWNGYVKLAMKVDATLPKLEVIGIKVQDAASGNFMKHWEAMLQLDLPDLISDKYFQSLQAAFVKLGMTADQFINVWQRFDKLDPTKALELLNLVADSLINFDKVSHWNTQIDTGSFKIGGFNYQRGLAEVRSRNSPAANLAEADKEIRKLAGSISSLVGEEQIRAVNQFSQLLVDRMEEQNRLAEEFNNFLKDSNRQFEDMRQTLYVEGMGKMVTNEKGEKEFQPDLNAKYRYWEGQLQNIMARISSANNLDELNYWQGEFFKASGNMGDIAKQIGPEAYEAWRQWMIGADGNGGVLGMFHEQINTTVSRWGEELTAKNDQLFNDIQPVIDRFKGTIDDTNGAADRLKEGFIGLIDPVERFKTAMEDAIPVIERVGGNVGSENPAQTTNDNFGEKTLYRRLAVMGNGALK